MAVAGKKIYLASRSPRRRELLAQIGVGFELLLYRDDPSRGGDVDETPLPNENPQDYVMRVSQSKADAGWTRVLQRRLPQFPVLAADTAVVLDDKILGKPANREQALEMLALLSGRRHEVLTAVTVIGPSRVEQRLSTSAVWFSQLPDPLALRYVMSGEPLDKAGAYAIQGYAAAFIEKIAGSYSGVMGLPLYETAQMLALFDIEIL